MRSGNKVSFKNMGSSPVKQSKYQLEQKAQMQNESDRIDLEEKQFQAGTKAKKRDHQNRINTITGTPVKQKLNKGGEGQDQNKIFNDKGEHVGDYVNDKVVMKLKELVQKEPKFKEAQIPPGFKRPVSKKDIPVKPKDGDYEKYSDLEKYDDDNPTGKAERPKKKKSLKKSHTKKPSNKELMKMMEEQKSPAKQAKTKGLGPRTAFGGVKKSGNGFPSAARTFRAVTHEISWTVNHADSLTFPQGMK